MTFLMVVSGLFQGLTPIFAAEPKVVDIDITKFEIQNADHTTANAVYYTDTFLLMLKWDASKNGATIHEGDYFDVTLPDKMKFPSNTSASDFNLLDPDGIIVAQAHVTPGPGDIGGTVHVTFTNAVENKNNVKGTMYLAAKFDKTQITVGEENTFTITVNGEVSEFTQTGTVGVNISGPKPLIEEYLHKWGGKVDGVLNQAKWNVRINHHKATMSNVVVTDTLQLDGESFIPESFQLHKVTFDEYGRVVSQLGVVDLSGILSFNEDKSSFTLNLGDVAGEQYYFEYKSTYTPGTKLRNKLNLTSTEHSHDFAVSYQSADSGGTGGGDLTGKIKLIKVDKDDNTIKLANAVFTVTRPDETIFELTTGADGTVISGNLTQGTYKVKEKTAPKGYLPSQDEYTLNVTPTGGAIQEIENERIKINISGEKIWNDGNNQDGKRPDAIIVNLLANGNKVAEKEVKADANGKWSYTFENMPEYQDEKKIDYTVTENTVEGCNTEILGNNIVNSYTPGKTSVTVTKRWNDNNNQDGIRPNKINVQLYADGEMCGNKVELNEINHWTTTWNNLPEKKDGAVIKYTVKEVEMINGYTSTVYDQDLGNAVIYNNHTPEKTEVSGVKTWNDSNNRAGQRPTEITVNLLADGEKVAEKTVRKDANGKWSYNFVNLPKYKDGQEIKYTITEDSVKDYSTEVNGYDIKNSYTAEKTSVTVTKRWDDCNDKDNIRPESITAQLYANGEKVGNPVKLSVGNDWTYTWSNLSQYKDEKAITYTVKEIGRISGYTETVDDNNHGNIIITNKHIPNENNFI